VRIQSRPASPSTVGTRTPLSEGGSGAPARPSGRGSGSGGRAYPTRRSDTPRDRGVPVEAPSCLSRKARRRRWSAWVWRPRRLSCISIQNNALRQIGSVARDSEREGQRSVIVMHGCDRPRRPPARQWADRFGYRALWVAPSGHQLLPGPGHELADGLRDSLSRRVMTDEPSNGAPFVVEQGIDSKLTNVTDLDRLVLEQDELAAPLSRWPMRSSARREGPTPSAYEGCHDDGRRHPQCAGAEFVKPQTEQPRRERLQIGAIAIAAATQIAQSSAWNSSRARPARNNSDRGALHRKVCALMPVRHGLPFVVHAATRRPAGGGSQTAATTFWQGGGWRDWGDRVTTHTAPLRCAVVLELS
jgi:hypothetical protein